MAENKLEEVLNKTVKIDVIQLNPLRGIELTNILIGDEDLQLLSVKKVSLLYNFKQLLRNKLVINRISITKPVIKLRHVQNQWNIPLLKSGTQLKERSQPAVTRKTIIPALPLDINLNAFIIKDLQLSLNYDNNITTEISGLNLFLAGNLSSASQNINARITSSPESVFSFQQVFPEKIKFQSSIKNDLNITLQNHDAIPIKGEVKFNNLSAFYNNHISLKHLSLGFDFLLDIEKKEIKFNQMNLVSNNFFELNIKGKVYRILKQPKFDFTLINSFINLKQANQYIAALIPVSKIEGNLDINSLSLTGSLINQEKSIAAIQGSFSFNNIGVVHSKRNISLQNASGNIKLNKLDLKNYFPDKFDAEIKLHLDNFTSKSISLTDLQENIHLFSSEKSPDEQIIDFDIKSNEIKLNIVNQRPIAFPVKVNGSLVGNLKNLEVKNILASWNLTEAASGKISATYLSSDQKKFVIKNAVDLDFKKIRNYIPDYYLKNIKGLNLSGKLSSRINLNGQLNNQYLPEKIEFKANNNLKSTSADYNLLEASLTGLNAESFANGKYNRNKGIEFSLLKFYGDFLNIKYSDQINIEKSKYFFATKNLAPFHFNNPTGININFTGKVESELVESLPIAGKLNQLKTKLAFSAVASKEKSLRKIKLTGDLAVKNFQMRNKIFADSTKLAFRVDSPSIYFSKPQIDLKLTSRGLRTQNKKRDGIKNNVRAHLLLLFDKQKQSIAIKNADIISLPLFRASLHKGLYDFEKKFHIQDLDILLDLKQLSKNIPSTYRNKIPMQNLSGEIRISTSAEGTVPSEINLGDFDLPFKFNLNVNADKMFFKFKNSDVQINNFNSTTNINNLDSKTIKISGKTSVSSVVESFQSIIPELTNISFQYDYSLKDLNALSINNSFLKINNEIISHSLKGEIKGFYPLLIQNVPLRASEILKRISLKLNSRLSIKKGIKLSLISPVRFSGGLSTDFFIKLVPEEKISLKGNIGFKNFILENNDFHINKITGNIPINKSYLLVNKKTNHTQKNQDKFISQTGLFDGLRNYSSHKNLISISSIQAGKYSFNQILLDIFLNTSLFAVEQFFFEVEGGTVLGNTYFLPDNKGYKLSLKSNFAGIDLKKILKLGGRNKSKLDSKVNGNADLIVNILTETEPTDFTIDQIDMDLNITHIGDNALNEILIYFDPSESNPSVADLKEKLKLAKPSQINIKIKNERLSMFVRLKTHLTESGFLDIQALNRIPVQRLKQFSTISENLKEISPLLKIIKIWTSNYVKLDKNQLAFR